MVDGVTTELYRKFSSCQAVKNRGVRFNISHRMSWAWVSIFDEMGMEESRVLCVAKGMFGMSKT